MLLLPPWLFVIKVVLLDAIFIICCKYIFFVHFCRGNYNDTDIH